jgi:hypothetical protein
VRLAIRARARTFVQLTCRPRVDIAGASASRLFMSIGDVHQSAADSSGGRDAPDWTAIELVPGEVRAA